MKKNIFKLSIFTITITLSLNTYAQYIRLDNFHYRDYLDFGQNKGAFQPNNQGIQDYQGKNGNTMTFDHIPDFSSRNLSGNTVSLGRNTITTMRHKSEDYFKLLSSTPRTSKNFHETWGNTRYVFQTGQNIADDEERTQKLYGMDTLYLRTDKYIVEGHTNPLNINLNTPSGTLHQEEQVCKKLPTSTERLPCFEAWQQHYAERAKKIQNELDKFQQYYQSGTGEIIIFNHPVPKYQEKAIGLSDIRGGSVYQAYRDNLSYILYDYSTKDERERAGMSDGLIINSIAAKPFENGMTTGDSGSSIVGYDPATKEWYVLGVGSTAADNMVRWSPVLKSDVDDYQKQFTHYISGDEAPLKNKDNIYTDGQNINIQNDLNLGHGGLVFSNHKTYNINGGNIKKIAGIDIEQGSTVNLTTTLSEDLHKVGDGTLNVEAQTNTNLRFGSGSVNIKNEHAFNHIYITGKDALLKLGNDFQIANKVFFGNSGGKVDLNGIDQEVSNIPTNNNSATYIINSNNKKAQISFNPQQQTIIHAHIGDTEHNNLDLNTNTTAPIAFDGGLNISGKLNINANNNITLQGHPRTHAYINDTGKKPGATGERPKTACYLDTSSELNQSNPQVYFHNQAANQRADEYFISRGHACLLERMSVDLPAYMDLTRPSTLEQPDWDKREYHAKSIQLNNNAVLNIGKGAKVFANINATNAQINLGGNNFKHFIDAKDEKNTTGNGFSYQQENEQKNLTTGYRGFLQSNSIQLNNSTLNAYNSDIISQHVSLRHNASIQLKEHSNLSLEHLDLADNNNISTDESSNLYVKTLNVPNEEVTLNANTHISEQLIVEEGTETHVKTNRHIYLQPRAHFAIRLSNRLLNSAINQSYTVPFDGLVDERENKYQIDFLNKPEDLYFIYTYDPENHEIVLTRKKEDPTSNENLEDLLNGNKENEDPSKVPPSPIPVPNPGENQIVGPENKPHKPQVSDHEQQLFNLILLARNELTSLNNQLIQAKLKNSQKDLLKLIRHTEQDFNTLAKDNFILNKVNFLTRTLGDQQKENLWLNSGYSNNKFKTNHIMLGTNLNYHNLTLGAAIGQFNVKTDNQDADVTLVSGKLVKNFENHWAIQSHLTGLWANNDFNFYSESVKAPQKASYKEYAVNFDMLAAYQYPLSAQLNITPKLGLGYSFEHSNKVATQDFSKAKYQRQLVNLLAGVGIDYQLNQFTFGAHLDMSQAFILKGKEQQLGFNNNTTYKIKNDNPDTMLSLGLQARYQVTNNFNLNAETGSSTLSPFYINLGLGYRF